MFNDANAPTAAGAMGGASVAAPVPFSVNRAGRLLNRSWMQGLLRAAAIAAAFLVAGCATSPKVPGAAAHDAPAAAVRGEEETGVEIVGLRRTAAGHMLDLRYRVVDPDKASVVLDRGTAAYLISETTGARMEVPETRLGRMRQSTRKPEMGRVYFMLFGTAGQRVSAGDRFTAVIGAHRFEKLTVQ